MTDRAITLRMPPRSPTQPAPLTLEQQSRQLADWLATWRSFLAVNEAILVQSDITAREFAALLEVDRSDEPQGPTVGMLAKRLRIRHNTSVGLVTRMCDKGYVQRIRDAQDHRHAHVQLTDHGHQVLAGLVRAHGREFQELRMELVPVTAA